MTTGRDNARFTFGYRRCADQDAGQAVRHPVIVVGAGPVGLATAIDLGRRGVPVVLLDDADRIGEGSRGICYSKRCLEILDALGVGQAVAEMGVRWQVGRVYFGDREVYAFDLLPEPGHKMPAFVNLQQYYLEKLLVDRAEALGNIDLRWRNQVVGLERAADGATIDIETPDGPYQLVADWLIAADGARSAIRRLMGLDFIGETFRDQFLITDIRMAAELPAERRFWFEPPFHSGQSTLLHKQPDNVWRVDFQIGWDADPEAETKPDAVRARLDRMLKGQAYEIEWVSVYTFQCRRLERFVHDRVVFVGDAAHQVSPFGARGGNSGIEDAHNLGWKLAMVLNGTAPAVLIESYGSERQQAADDNIRHSTRSTDFLVPKSEGARHLRNAVLDLADAHDFARRMVNSGRLHSASAYASRLSAADSDDFAGAVRPGAPVLDAPLRDRAGQPLWLLDLLPDGFSLIHAGEEDRPDPPDGVTLITIGEELRDPGGHFTRRYDATPGACWLIRPDHYVAGCWRGFDRGVVEKALRRATGEGDG